MRKRLSVWRRIVWHGGVSMIAFLLGAPVSLFFLIRGEVLPNGLQNNLHLSALPSPPSLLWPTIILVLFVAVVLEGTYRLVGEKENELATTTEQAGSLRSEIQELNSELGTLRDTRADVSIFFAKEPPMYSSVEHWYRILVKNHSTTASAQGVDVRLINIDPLPPDISPVIFPTSLGVKDRERIDIAPNDKWTFDVVQDCGTTLRVLTKISRRGSTYQGITSSIVVGLRYRMTLGVTSDNPLRTDRNGEERIFILCQPTGNIGDLEFYEEKANPEPVIEPPVESTPNTAGSQPQ